MDKDFIEYQQNTLLRTPEEKQMGVFLHISHLANLIFYPLGYIISIAIWQTKKDEMPALDLHGKEATNWIITSTIYHLINFVILIFGIFLTFFVIGFFVIFVNFLVFLGLIIASITFSIIAALKANDGEHWEYPMNIKFLK